MMTVGEREEIERWNRRGVIIDRCCMVAMAFGGSFLLLVLACR
jgi:hypothetical protein